MPSPPPPPIARQTARWCAAYRRQLSTVRRTRSTGGSSSPLATGATGPAAESSVIAGQQPRSEWKQQGVSPLTTRARRALSSIDGAS
ncbi:hypothetical protein [Streptomyces sp. MA15]|uniref:hypothetical protein n=1 Tax=Streptomyces sp. MA15 TaxID=3055061 RepID=UPI0025B002CD|nr:hypothetical protein [Streptomyces sp. MA15]MDN3267518.1 hypothetical protein [Streptomyces sp. MA15]